MPTINRYTAASIARRLGELSVLIERLGHDENPIRDLDAEFAQNKIARIQEDFFAAALTDIEIEAPEPAIVRQVEWLPTAPVVEKEVVG